MFCHIRTQFYTTIQNDIQIRKNNMSVSEVDTTDTNQTTTSQIGTVLNPEQFVPHSDQQPPAEDSAIHILKGNICLPCETHQPRTSTTRPYHGPPSHVAPTLSPEYPIPPSVHQAKSSSECESSSESEWSGQSPSLSYSGSETDSYDSDITLTSTSPECSKPALERNSQTDLLVNALLSDVISQNELDKLKELETKLAAKVENGHFRCKIKHSKIYKQMMKTHRENTTLDLLKMLNHDYDTQGVEAINKSCSALAPKGETF